MSASTTSETPGAESGPGTTAAAGTTGAAASAASDSPGAAEVRGEADRRRTFAVISHPDAGKSTLTEALALHARVIQDAGVTHGKSSRHSTVSDWMGMEQERGISISSAALQFEHRDTVLNLVDTPGHADFSEDTYRVLAAVDCAVMLIDAAKGFEPQTLKLLDVCKQRGLPIVTVINKWDRPGHDALGLIDEIGERTAMVPVPLTWPAGIAGSFEGLIDIRNGRSVKLEAVEGGALPAREEPVNASELDPTEAELWETAEETADLVVSSHGGFDRDSFRAAELTPVLFTAAARNYGVRQLLDVLVELAPPATARTSSEGVVRDVDSDFSGFVFKVQSGQNASHRDHIAFMRICSGVFERGMVINNARTDKPFATKYAHRVVGRTRQALETAWPGDVVGLVNAASLRVGDSLFRGKPVEFAGIPHFAPEHFVVCRATDPGRYKQFRRGIGQLEHEGVIQVFRSDLRGDQAPVLAAVGPLQFEVAEQRMREEFRAPVKLESMEYTLIRRATEGVDTAPQAFRGGEILYRGDGEAVAVFADRYKIAHFTESYPKVTLSVIGS
ncbi:peptide chain release factor 3 [Arthrobacter sp. H14]|uniref:peptide chain release factor 3 n=1 Tax=Arthrobacter sp. H14 TaxID=1312959 RepID=UPI0004B4DE3E|nr:peptide chain release factor 3 [Arthrobacter sp. H14]